MVSTLLPNNFTLYLSKIPDSYSSMAKFNPVCPPSVGSKASGASFSRIFSIMCIVRGSIYTLSAISASVIMVAGFEFINTVSIPSSLSDLQA